MEQANNRIKLNNNFPDYYNPEKLFSNKLQILLYIIWPGIIAIQWIILLVLSWKNGSFFIVDCYCVPGPIEKIPIDMRIVPFARDYFFIYWNLLPFGFSAVIWLAEKRTSRAMIYGIPKHNHQLARKTVRGIISMYEKIWFHYSFFLLPLGIALVGCNEQIKKVNYWHNPANWYKPEIPISRYWWDSNISFVVFDVRLVTLFINLFILPIFFLASICLLHTFIKLIYTKLWEVDLLNADKCGGLSVFGKATVTFTMIPFLTATSGLLGSFDHKAEGITHVCGDVVMLAFGTLFAFIIFIVPLRPIHKGMRQAKHEILESLKSIMSEYGTYQPKFFAEHKQPADIEKIRNKKKDWDTVNEMYQLYANARTWPINIKMRTQFTGTIIGPITFFIIDQLFPILASIDRIIAFIIQ